MHQIWWHDEFTSQDRIMKMKRWFLSAPEYDGTRGDIVSHYTELLSGLRNYIKPDSKLKPDTNWLQYNLKLDICHTWPSIKNGHLCPACLALLCLVLWCLVLYNYSTVLVTHSQSQWRGVIGTTHHRHRGLINSMITQSSKHQTQHTSDIRQCTPSLSNGQKIEISDRAHQDKAGLASFMDFREAFIIKKV